MIVFIGYSVSWPTSVGGDGTAVGLQFVDMSIIKGDRTDVVDPRDAGQSLPRHSYYVPQMKTHAKILFVAACVIGDQFKAWWNIDSSTPDQAIVVPVEVGATGLNAASQVWLSIQQQMMSGHVSLKEALAYANGISSVKFKAIGGNGGARIYLR